MYVFAHIKKHIDTIHKHALFKNPHLGPSTLAFTLQKSPAEINGTAVPIVLYYCQRERLCCSSRVARFLLFSDILGPLLTSIQLWPCTCGMLLSSNQSLKLGINQCSVPNLPNPRNRATIISLRFFFFLRVANKFYLEVSFSSEVAVVTELERSNFPFLFLKQTNKNSHWHQLACFKKIITVKQQLEM